MFHSKTGKSQSYCFFLILFIIIKLNQYKGQNNEKTNSVFMILNLQD